MNFDEPTTQKRSLGKLRITKKTKPRSPDLTGQLQLQRHTAAVLAKQFDDTEDGEIICNIAGWSNQDYRGPYLTVELSPRYAPLNTQAHQANLAFIFKNQEDQN
jgi:hypothetical protein